MLSNRRLTETLPAREEAVAHLPGRSHRGRAGASRSAAGAPGSQGRVRRRRASGSQGPGDATAQR
ncbi:MAG: hypothetical protein R2854_13635 [Caldilineaceae bacterium]